MTALQLSISCLVMTLLLTGCGQKSDLYQPTASSLIPPSQVIFL